MQWAEPTLPHQLSDTADMLLVGLHRHGLEGCAQVVGLQQLHAQATRPTLNVAMASVHIFSCPALVRSNALNLEIKAALRGSIAEGRYL